MVIQNLWLLFLASLVVELLSIFCFFIIAATWWWKLAADKY